MQPEINSMQIDVRLCEDNSPFLEGTKCIITQGEYACHTLLPETRDNTLGEVRGGIYSHKGIPTIPTFSAQEAADIKNYEDELNNLSKNYTGDGEASDSDEEEGDGKRHGKTKRANYAFWIKADCRKAKHILSHGVSVHTHPAYIIQPPVDGVINILTNTKNQHLYFDIETYYEEQNLLCFAFSFEGREVYSIPILDYNYRMVSQVHHIMRALAIAVRDNVVVAHNGAAFDFFVLANKYHIPINKTYDTMLAMHRCFPDIERSLGHCTSLWTNERFHKDTDSRAYATAEHMRQKLMYCAKDVWTMFLIKQSIDKYARTIPGLADSIATAMSCIKPYLTTSLQGIKYSDAVRQKVLADNDVLLNKYLMLIEYLIGTEGMANTRKAVKGKAKTMPNSNSQCCEYFHNLMGYAVVGRSLKTGKPSLAKKNLYKLQLKNNNPVMTLISVFRAVAKESSMLKFVPWKDDNNKVINYAKFVDNI